MPHGPTHTEQPPPATGALEKLLNRWARKTLAVYWPTLAILTHWPHLKIANPEIVGLINLDKIIHTSAFSFLTLLLIFARLPSRAVAMRHHVVVGTFVAVIYAIFDELTQTFVGREVSAGDILANLVGIMLVMLTVWRWRVVNAESAHDNNHPTETITHPIETKLYPLPQPEGFRTRSEDRPSGNDLLNAFSILWGGVGWGRG